MLLRSDLSIGCHHCDGGSRSLESLQLSWAQDLITWHVHRSSRVDHEMSLLLCRSAVITQASAKEQNVSFEFVNTFASSQASLRAHRSCFRASSCVLSWPWKQLHKQLSQRRFQKKKSCMTRRLSTRVAWSRRVVGVPHLHRNGLLRPVLVLASSSLPPLYNSVRVYQHGSIEGQNPNGSYRIHLLFDWTSVYHSHGQPQIRKSELPCIWGTSRRLALSWLDATHRLGVNQKMLHKCRKRDKGSTVGCRTYAQRV